MAVSTENSRSVGPSTVAARSPATRAPLDRRAEPVHAARNARADARECGSCSRPPRRRSHSLTASRLARFDRHHHLSSQVPCRESRARSFAGRHFELVRRGSRGAAAPHHRLRNLTAASEIRGEIAVSRSGNCRLLSWAGAILRYSGCYSCAMLVLFLRYSCVILALFVLYSCVIPLLFWLYSFGYSLGTTPLWCSSTANLLLRVACFLFSVCLGRSLANWGQKRGGGRSCASKRGAAPQMLLTRPPRRTTAAFPNFWVGGLCI